MYSKSIPHRETQILLRSPIPAHFAAIGNFSSHGQSAEQILSEDAWGLQNWWNGLTSLIANKLKKRLEPTLDQATDHFLRLDNRQMVDEIRWMRRAYNFDLTLIFTFEGKKFVEDVDWNQAEKIAKEGDRQWSENLKQIYSLSEAERERGFHEAYEKEVVPRELHQVISGGNLEKWLSDKNPMKAYTSVPVLALSREQLIEKAGKVLDSLPLAYNKGSDLIDQMLSSNTLEIKEFKVYALAHGDRGGQARITT
jgi:hypothetical protein